MIDNDFAPFLSVGDFALFVFYLFNDIEYERRAYNDALKHFNALGGFNANPNDFRLAMEWEHEAEKHLRAVHCLEYSAEELRKRLSPEGLDVFNRHFGNNNRKAG